jgi:hypothetical protein
MALVTRGLSCIDSAFFFGSWKPFLNFTFCSSAKHVFRDDQTRKTRLTMEGHRQAAKERVLRAKSPAKHNL